MSVEPLVRDKNHPIDPLEFVVFDEAALPKCLTSSTHSPANKVAVGPPPGLVWPFSLFDHKGLSIFVDFSLSP